MTRERILEILSDLPFAFIDPGSWEDIGFTEREIWVNSKGYGYVMCDEPIGCWEDIGLSQAEWTLIKSKLADESLGFHDICGTILEEILSASGYEDDYFEEGDLSEVLKNLSQLNDEQFGHFYAILTDDIPLFFGSEAEFKKAYERDWADEFWADIDSELLSEWLKRLCDEDDDCLIAWAKRNGLTTKSLLVSGTY